MSDEERIEISPADIRHKEFKTGVMGYNKAEIREYLDMLAEHFEDLYAQRYVSQDESPQLNVFEDRAQTHLALDQIQKREELISKTLIQAENTRGEIIRTAHKDAENIVKEAELVGKKAIDDTQNYLNSLKHEFVTMKETHRQFLLSSHSQLKVMLERLEQDPLFTKEKENKLNQSFDDVRKVVKIEAKQDILDIFDDDE